MSKLLLSFLMIPSLVFAGEAQHFSDSFISLNNIHATNSSQSMPLSAYINEALSISRMTSPVSAYKVYIETKPDPDAMTRGKGIKLYKETSKSVVLIATNDAIGTGSLISSDGEIITNWHVIKGFDTVSVIFKPEKKGDKISKKDIYNGKVIRVDEIADLALLKLDSKPKKVKPLNLGNDIKVEIAQDVHAIGHPSGKDWTYTRGFISQIRNNYEWDSGENITHKADVIQTQTPISPGNSGGPLLDNDGNIIGVNTFKVKGESLNFAVAAQEVKKFLERKESRFVKKEESCSAIKIIKEGSNDDFVFTTFDTMCDGKVNAIYKVPKDDLKPITFSFDTNKDSEIDLVVYDEDRDKKWDYSLIDTTGDGKANMVGKHKNGELLPYMLEPIEEKT